MLMDAKEIGGAGGRERTGVGLHLWVGTQDGGWLAHAGICRNAHRGTAASAKAWGRKHVATCAEQQGGRRGAE